MTTHRPDDEWFRQAAKIESELKTYVEKPNLFTLSVYPAYKGGWRKGYTWNGNFKLILTPNTYGRSPGTWATTPKKFYFKGGIEEARKLIDVVAPWIGHANYYARLLWMYRESGLLSKGIARLHSKRLKEKYANDWTRNPEAVREAHEHMARYLRKHAPCPHCNQRGFSEVIWGWQCKHCHRSINDVGIKIYWEDETPQTLI